MLVVSCVISRSACTRKYRDASESSGREEGKGKEKELRGERGGREWYRKPCKKQFVQRVYIHTVKEKIILANYLVTIVVLIQRIWCL